jgi:2Fe-2S ferredoxin
MKATWRLADGREISADVREGMSLMEAAVAIGVPRVVGECGGNLSCATCHVVVEDAWAGLTGTPDAFEAEREPNSRLSCQIRMRAEIDGIVVRVPEA